MNSLKISKSKFLILNYGVILNYRLTFHVPTRALLGFRSEMLNDTKGTGVMDCHFLEYQEHKGALKKNQHGAMISSHDGVCCAYGINEIDNKGMLFIKPGQKVI